MSSTPVYHFIMTLCNEDFPLPVGLPLREYRLFENITMLQLLKEIISLHDFKH